MDHNAGTGGSGPGPSDPPAVAGGWRPSAMQGGLDLANFRHNPQASPVFWRFSLTVAVLIGAISMLQLAGVPGAPVLGLGIAVVFEIARLTWRITRERRLRRKATALQLQLSELKEQETNLLIAEARANGAFDRFESPKT